MLHKENTSKDLTQDLCKLLKEEGDFVKELSDAAYRACIPLPLMQLNK